MYTRKDTKDRQKKCVESKGDKETDTKERGGRDKETDTRESDTKERKTTK